MNNFCSGQSQWMSAILPALNPHGSRAAKKWLCPPHYSPNEPIFHYCYSLVPPWVVHVFSPFTTIYDIIPYFSILYPYMVYYPSPPDPYIGHRSSSFYHFARTNRQLLARHMVHIRCFRSHARSEEMNLERLAS